MPIIGNPLNSVAFLTDSFNGNGSTTAFTMSVAPATSSSILVNITGVTQAPSTYSVVGTTLTFSTAPPSGTANISVRYLGIPASGVVTTAYRTLTEFTATASQTTFTPPSYTVGFIAVYQNGVMLGSTDYTATNGTTVVLAVGALVNDLVSTESFYVSSVLNALPVTGGTISGNLVVTGTASITGVTTLTGGLNTPLAVTSGGTGVATSTGSGANVLGTSPTITGATITVASTAAPAFSAYNSTLTAIPNATATKVLFQTEEFDTNSNFASSAFTPTVAGYYQVNSSVQLASPSASLGYVAIHKNGASAKRGWLLNGSSYGFSVSAIVYLNGSTDYIEAYVYQSSGASVNTNPVQDTTYFQAAMIRSA